MVRQARAVRLEPRRVADPRCTASAVCAVPDAAEPTWRRITRARRGAGARCAVPVGARWACCRALTSLLCRLCILREIRARYISRSTVSRVSLSVAISFGPTTAEPEDSKYFMYEYDTGYSRRSYRYSLHLYSSASSRLRAPASSERELRPPASAGPASAPPRARRRCAWGEPRALPRASTACARCGRKGARAGQPQLDLVEGMAMGRGATAETRAELVAEADW